jgi:hypothetical protein
MLLVVAEAGVGEQDVGRGCLLRRGALHDPRGKSTLGFCKIASAERCAASLSRGTIEPGSAPGIGSLALGQPVSAEASGARALEPWHGFTSRDRMYAFKWSKVYRGRPPIGTKPISRRCRALRSVATETPKSAAASRSVIRRGRGKTVT